MGSKPKLSFQKRKLRITKENDVAVPIILEQQTSSSEYMVMKILKSNRGMDIPSSPFREKLKKTNVYYILAVIETRCIELNRCYLRCLYD